LHIFVMPDLIRHPAEKLKPESQAEQSQRFKREA
jgi:hypothetical protein